MTAVWIEPFAGIAGDMTVAALLDLGFPADELRAGLQGLDAGEYELQVHPATRNGFACTRFLVEADEEKTHRGLDDIEAMLQKAGLVPRVLERSIEAFRALAGAEALAHGCGVQEVHFHEVGAVDAIIDIVGAALGLEYFDVSAVYCSRIRVGTGEVECRHGVIPVPAPAALNLLRGLPVQLAEGEGETVTPTGAAMLKAWAKPVGTEMSLSVQGTGCGAGSRDDTRLPNMLRISLVDVALPSDLEALTELSANLDDLSPEIVAFAVERLLSAGALDAWVTPVQMKKGRPGYVLSALAASGMEDVLEKVFFAETSTLGVRRTPYRRRVLDRRCIYVETEYGSVRVKIGGGEGEPTVRAPEFEDCARIAREAGVPLRVVYRAALDAVSERPQ